MGDNRRQRVVLVGAGHAHLHLADQAAQFIASGVDVTLVDDGSFWYSGMATGMLGGMYSDEQDRIDSRRLIESRGGQFMAGRVVGLDAARQVAVLDDGREVPYDAISFNVGSEVALGKLPPSPRLWAVKPIHNLWRLRQHLETRLKAGERVNVAVIGGGATGCEVAANVVALARRTGGQVGLTLVSRSEQLLSRHARGASAFMQRFLQARGVRLRLGAQVQAIEDDHITTTAGESVACDVAIAATGLQAPSWVSDLGLAVDEHKGLRVDAMLRSVDEPIVFGAGDCIAFTGRDLPKLGVFGVRQAPVLLDNLMAALHGRALTPYRPQKQYLAILNLGDGTALALRGSAWWHGRSMLWLKDRIDRRFLAQYR